jgi:hypothetical protein
MAGKKRTVRPAPMVELTDRGITPLTAADAEEIGAHSVGQCFDLVPQTKARSLHQLRLYWSVLDKIVEATGQWPRAEYLHDFLVRQCGYVRHELNPFTGAREEVRDSVAFDGLTQDAMNDYVDAALAALSSWCEFDVLDLLPKQRGRSRR